jgi:hypothetical protein
MSAALAGADAKQTPAVKSTRALARRMPGAGNEYD